MADKIKQPVTKGVAKVPVIMQMESLECGAACLAMISAYYGKWVPLEQVRIDCGVSRDGSNAKNILMAARNYGMEAAGYRFEPESLKNEGEFPCIIHWNFNHFVVLDGFRSDKAVLNDPARGTVSVSMKEFDESFTGIVLMMKPGESFEPGGKPKSVLAFAASRLEGAKAAIIFVTLTTAISYLFSIINPVMTQIFMDRLLTGVNPEWLMPFITVMAMLAVVQIIVQWFSAVYSLKINGKMSVIGSMSYMWKIMRMPMEFFSQRMVGDLLSRQATNASIAQTLVGTLAPLLLNTVMMVFYLVVMIRYSVVLTLVGITTMVLNLLMSRFISNRRINLMRAQARDAGKLSSTTMNGISMIETIKSAGAENGYFQRWAGYQASMNEISVNFTETNTFLGLIPAFLSSMSNYVVLFLGVYYAMNQNFTLGMIMTFQSVLQSFMSPAMTLINAGQQIQEMRTSMERVEDVMQYPSDPYFKDEPIDDNASYAKLTGKIEMKNVTFGYSRLSDPLIKDFSMSVEPGQRIAFVGSSGCGKSTITKLICGLNKPWSGEVLFDGKPIIDIDRSVFTGSLAVVDQDIIIYEDTIANNIRMWDESIEDFEVIMAARDAQIHDDIMHRDGGYQYKLTENGKDMSGGQRQRLEIARVLAQDPTIIILDEATSALDAKTEYEVVEAIKKRGITCIVVAHRLSTIRDCDEIVVLDHGNVVERGTHNELFAKGGYYTDLIVNE
ncbi:MAG: NHLP family bacteriocin export ABC transporter peptidase/permease/ATPase subunit [Solobacterium sp.]|nr:NHLP family bacteriocin export ABC transporter peptidase/permease/ATPase subunit [Solobacterium sp.]